MTVWLISRHYYLYKFTRRSSPVNLLVSDCNDLDFVSVPVSLLVLYILHDRPTSESHIESSTHTNV